MGQGMFFLAAPSCRRRGRRLQLPPRDSHVFSCVLESRPAVSHGRGLLYLSTHGPDVISLILSRSPWITPATRFTSNTVWIMSHGFCALYIDTLERGFSKF